MKFKIFIAFIIICKISSAQTVPFYKNYNWEERPSYKVKDNTKELIAIKDKAVTEFYFEGENLIEYFLEHKIFWLNSDDAIEDFNKIYLPFSSTSTLEASKARVITPEKKVIILDSSKILTSKDEDTGRIFKYFALEGIIKGSYIEYFYVIKKSPRYTGKRYFFQTYYNKEKVEFDLYAPKNLVFKFKSYNGLDKVKQDTLTKEKLHYKLYKKGIVKVEDEFQAPYNASKQFLIYKLDRNLANNTSGIVSYNKVAQNLYSFYYTEYPKTTVSLLNKFIKELKLSEEESEVNKLRKIDNFIKNNIFSQEVYNKELEELEEVLKNKVGNETGVLKLYVALFRTLNIKHELVLTTDRKEMKFDKKFEANNFLQDFLFYFSKSKKYLSPNAPETRFGFPSPNNLDNYGLFIKEVKIGDYKSAIGKVKYINPVLANETVDVMNVEVSFNEDNLTENKVHFDRTFSGYYAMNIQPYMNFIKGEKRDDLVDNFVKNVSKNLEVIKREIKNEDPELFGVKPLQFIVDFKTEDFIEKAGKKYLFKLGDLIGPQVQLYQEQDRVLPLEEEFHRSYYRTLVINLPKGYKITNLEDINIDNSFSKEDKEFFSFKSCYKLEENRLTVTANEFYRENIIPVDLYEEYRTVINSAADFNKIVLLLESK